MKKNQLQDSSADLNSTLSAPTNMLESLPRASEALTELSPSNQSPSDQSVLDQSPSSSTKKRLPLILGGLILLVIGAVFGGRWWQFQQTHAETDNAQIQGHLSPIAARISATVQKFLVKECDHVES